jgi:hypothetical protein
MSALSSTVEKGERPDGVRALRPATRVERYLQYQKWDSLSEDDLLIFGLLDGETFEQARNRVRCRLTQGCWKLATFRWFGDTVAVKKTGLHPMCFPGACTRHVHPPLPGFEAEFQSANERKSQPVETVEKSANDKELESEKRL